jgi:hypothetical protein
LSVTIQAIKISGIILPARGKIDFKINKYVLLSTGQHYHREQSYRERLS